jgi:hypothetical protein
MVVVYYFALAEALEKFSIYIITKYLKRFVIQIDVLLRFHTEYKIGQCV